MMMGIALTYAVRGTHCHHDYQHHHREWSQDYGSVNACAEKFFDQIITGSNIRTTKTEPQNLIPYPVGYGMAQIGHVLGRRLRVTSSRRLELPACVD